MTLADLLSKQEGCLQEVQVAIWREISLGKKLHILSAHPNSDSVMGKKHGEKPGIR